LLPLPPLLLFQRSVSDRSLRSFPTRRSSDLRITMVKIFIDPGHGGSDPGASGYGLKEKDVTLTIALKLRNILNADYTGHSINMSDRKSTRLNSSHVSISYAVFSLKKKRQ